MAARKWLDLFGSRESQTRDSVAAKRRGGAKRRTVARHVPAGKPLFLEHLEDRMLLSVAMLSERLELILNDAGQVTNVYKCINSVPDTSTNLLSGSATAFAKQVFGSTTYDPTSVTRSGTDTLGNLTFTFPAPYSNSLVVHYEAKDPGGADTTKPGYFVFTVSSITTVPDKLMLLNYGTTLQSNVSGLSGVKASGSDGSSFAMYVRSLTPAGYADLIAHVDITNHTADPMVGASIALGGCDYGTDGSSVRNALKTMITTEGLVTSSVCGPWALDSTSTINQASYFDTATLSAANVQDWISLAKKGGIGIIQITSWWASLGHYGVDTAKFPGGLGSDTDPTSLAGVAKQIHDAGLKVGLHTLTAGIGTYQAGPMNDTYLTTGDPRLGKDYSYTLNTTITSAATSIVVNGVIPAGLLPTIWTYGSNGNVLQIGNELIQYTSYTNDGTNTTFTIAAGGRGAFGSTAAAHTAGVSTSHLKTCYYELCADPESTLNDEIATNLAAVINTCGADMVYLDGAEFAMNSYGVSKAKELVVSKIDHAVRVESSMWEAYSWTYQSNLGAFDFPWYGEKKFIDYHDDCLADWKPALLPEQLGWWGLRAWHEGNYSDSLLADEMEYQCAKALGNGYSNSFALLSPSSPVNGRQDDYLAMIEKWQSVTVDTAMKQRLSVAGDEFHLETAPDGSLHIAQASYDVKNAQGIHDDTNTASGHKVVSLSDGSQTWTVNNQYGSQYPTMRVEALYGVGSYTGTSQTIAGQSNVASFVKTSATGVSTPTLAWTTSQVPPAGSGETGSMAFSATNTSAAQTASWAKASLSNPLNINGKGALGVWIYGDGKGEILNFQPFNAAGYLDVISDHCVTVDFTGWKYVELPFREPDTDQYTQYTWPGNMGFCGRLYMYTIDSLHLGGINVYYNNVPQGETVTCYISSIKALPISSTTLTNTSVQIGSSTITFPAVLNSDEYFEFNSMTDCKIYDKNGFLISSITPTLTGTQPLLAQGSNTVTFNGTAQSGYSARAMVTIGSYDTQSANWDAATVGEWRFEEGSGVTAIDASPYLNNGTLSANVARVAGQSGSGSALQFNGTDTMVTIPASDTLNGITGSFSVQLQVKYSGAGSTGPVYWTLLNKNASSSGNNDPFHIWVNASDHQLCARVGNGTTNYQLNSGVNMSDGSYHLVDLVYDDVAKIYKLYVDGGNPRATQSVASNWTITRNSDAVTLGCWPAYGDYFNGIIDEVQILTRPLSQAEITSRIGNLPPTVVLGSIANSTPFITPSTTSISIPLSATASDSGGTINKVTFYWGSTWIADGVYDVASGTYKATWTPDTVGNFPITAKATDDDGAITISAASPKSIIVYGQPTNQAVDPGQTATFILETPGATSIPDPEGYWKLDETGTTTSASDASGNSHTGTWYGNTYGTYTSPQWTTGVINNAIDLDGLNDYISVPAPANSALEYTGGDMTISGWICVASGEGTTGGYLVSKAWNLNGYYNYRISLSSSKTVVFHVLGNVGATWAAYTITAPTALTVGQWYHIAATVNAAKEMKLYIDGSLAASGVHSFTSWIPSGGGDTDQALVIGTFRPHDPVWAGSTSESFTGKVDNVRFYTNVLSPAAVAEQACYYQWQKNGSNISGATGAYYTTFTTDADGTQYRVVVTNSVGSTTSNPVTLYVNSGLEASWKFDETTGTSAYDSVDLVNGHKGTWYGDTYGTYTLPQWTTGVINNAIDLDGLNDYTSVPAPQNSLLEYTGGDMTISEWICIGSGEGTTGGYLVSKPWNLNGYYNYRISLTSNNAVVFHILGNVGTTWAAYTITASTALTVGRWCHIAATVNAAKEMKLYIDGRLAASGFHSFTSWIPSGGGGNNGQPLVVGTFRPHDPVWTGNASESFTGKVDNVRFYTHALSPVAIAEQARCPVAYLKLNETSGTASDSSGNGSTGTLTNHAAFTTSGYFDGAVTLDGTDDYVSVNDTAALKYKGGDMTLSAWIKLDSGETSGFLISKPWNTTPQFNYQLYLDANKYVNFAVSNGTTTGTITTTTALTTGGWCHVAATVDGTKAMKLYIDGSLVQSGTHTITTWAPTDSNQPLGIGSSYPYNTAANSFDGTMDNVRVYNRALNAADVHTLAIDPPSAGEQATQATVQSVVVNDGNAQRSKVNSLTITFSQIVAMDAGAFELLKLGAGGGLVNVTVASMIQNGRTVATLVFSGDRTEYGSLKDGQYELTIRDDKVRDSVTGAALDGDGDGRVGGNYVFGNRLTVNFFRLYGDSDGDRDVDNLDFARFRTTMNRKLGDRAFLSYFDFDGDNDMDNLDFAHFRLQMGKAV